MTPEALQRVAPVLRRADELVGRLERLADQGITEVAFQPMGDVERELWTFAAAAGVAPS